jgi:hypothetical protein
MRISGAVRSSDTKATHRLRVLLASSRDLNSPPKMTRQKHGAALIWLFQQLTSVQCRFGDERIVVFLAEAPRALQRTCQNAYSLELCTTITDAVFVDGESLHKEFVRGLLKAALVCYLSTGNEKSEAEFRCAGIDPCIELNQSLVEESIQRRRLSGPVIIKMFSSFEFPGQL